jgi:hypothetical protein
MSLRIAATASRADVASCPIDRRQSWSKKDHRPFGRIELDQRQQAVDLVAVGNP